MYGWEGSFYRVQLCRSSSATSPCDGGVSCELLAVCAQDGAVAPSQPEQTPIQAPAMTPLAILHIRPPWMLAAHGSFAIKASAPLPANWPARYDSSHFILCTQIAYLSASRPGLISQDCDIFALFWRCAY